MKKTIILLLVFIFIGGLTIVIFNYKNKIDNIDINTNINTDVKVNNFEECLTANYIILESYPRQCKAPDGQTYVENIGNTLTKIDLINLTSPRPGQNISSPLLINGEARGSWYFEASFPIELYDANNNLIGQTVAQAQEDWMTEDFVPFEAELNFNYSASIVGTTGNLVLKKDNPSGLPENDDQLSLPIKFTTNQEKTKIKVFFSNDILDPEISCNKVFSIEREIIKTPAIARAAIEELLAGPTLNEKESGFSTSINSGVEIQSLSIENGIAKIDFNKQLEQGIGGSCRVSAIRAQIIETLKQFLSIKEVIISIDGRSEDILQP